MTSAIFPFCLTYLDHFRCIVILRNHLKTVLVELNDGVGMSQHLGLKGLMFLNFRLKVGGVFVGLIRGSLQLFVDPRLQLVGISLEVLETARVLQLGALTLRAILESIVAAENCLSAVLNLLNCF